MPPMMTRRRECLFCRKKISYIDYKDGAFLHRFLTQWSKIKEKRETGTCTRHQRLLAQAIKRARIMSVLPHTSR